MGPGWRRAEDPLHGLHIKEETLRRLKLSYKCECMNKKEGYRKDEIVLQIREACGKSLQRSENISQMGRVPGNAKLLHT